MFSWIATHPVAYPLLEVAHIVGIALLLGNLFALECARKVVWRNPHVEFDLQLPAGLKLPADLAQRPVPAQSAQVDGKRLLAAAQLPTRKDAVWHIELAPLTRLEAWGVAEIKPGDTISVLGFTFAQEKGEAVLRAEYLFAARKAYGLRSAPA